jgi:tetratricopeptide (TPR) repeat protein
MGAARVATAIAFLASFSAVAQSPQSEITPRLQELLKARQYSEAEHLLSQELISFPRWETGHLLLAQIYTQAKKYDLAERSALAAVAIRESLDGYMLLAVATMRMNRLNDSISWLEKAARRRPDHAEIYKVLGIDYALGGAVHEAEDAFRKAIKLGPENWEYHYFLGRMLFERGRFDEAHPVLQRAVQLNRSSVKAWTALGQVQERIGKDTAAAESYGQAIRLCGNGPDCAWPLLQFGYRYSKQAQFSEALPYFRRAAQVRPEWARTHFNLAKTLAELHDLAGARLEFELAVKLDDSQPEYHYQLGHIYNRLGEGPKANAAFTRFRSISQAARDHVDAQDFNQP